MKRLFAFAFSLLLVLLSVFGCVPTETPGQNVQEKRYRLSDFVGVWTDAEKSEYYRFTASGTWYCYNQSGEVLDHGAVELDQEQLTLSGEKKTEVLLVNGQDSIQKDGGIVFSRTESPESLISSQMYEHYFTSWYEESNLLGNVLTVSEPDFWKLNDPNGVTIKEGVIYAYAGEEEVLYLYEKETGDFYGMLSEHEKGILLQTHRDDGVFKTVFSTEDHSTNRYFYFKEKEVLCDYLIGSGDRLLRNGAAAYNDAHDYKKMPVTCRIEIVDDVVDENGLRAVKVSIIYDFYRRDLPILAGNRIYNSVRFSQYDYYTGQLFYMDDSTGDEELVCNWQTEHDGKQFDIQCSFSSNWEYSPSEEIAVRFCGTYDLVIPQDYDGFVFCLRPVYNSYSAQVSASISPEEGTLMLEDLGEDVSKSIFARLLPKEEPTGDALMIP